MLLEEDYYTRQQRLHIITMANAQKQQRVLLKYSISPPQLVTAADVGSFPNF